jgi:putative cell wall-binding protein
MVLSAPAFAADAKSSGASETVVYPGKSSQAAGDVTFEISTWNNTDEITLQVLEGANCTDMDAKEFIGIDGTPTVKSSPVDDARDNKKAPAFTVTVKSSGDCPSTVKDLIVLKPTNKDNASGDWWTVTVTGIKYNVGAGMLADGGVESWNIGVHIVDQKNSGSLDATETNAVLYNTKVEASSVVSSTPGKTVTLGTVKLSDMGPNAHIDDPIVFTLDNGAVFTADSKPELKGPGGTKFTLASGLGTNTITFNRSSGDQPETASSYTLTGAKVDLDNTPGVTQISATSDGDTVGEGDVVVAVTAGTDRIAGSDRWSTAAKMFDTDASSAVLVSGENGKFADALSASYLVGDLPYAGGILLTAKNSLPQIVKATLKKSYVETVYILGDVNSVSKAVADEVAATKNANGDEIEVVRIAGSDRYATNAAVNLYNGVSTVDEDTAIIATGQKFADALAAGPIARSEGYPIILTDGNSLVPSAKSSLINNPNIENVVILGDENSVPASVEKQLGDMGYNVLYRLGGKDRTETAALIAEWEIKGFAATSVYDGLDPLGYNDEWVVIARGDNNGFGVDALAAGPYCGDYEVPLLLTASNVDLGGGIPSFLSGKAGQVTWITALGLVETISQDVLNKAVASLR